MENQIENKSKNSSMVKWVSISIIIGSVIISGAILYTKYLDVLMFKKSGYDNQQTSDQINSQPNKLAKVSVDQDAVLGDKNAPLTLIEFSDFQCPFCRSFWRETLPQIKKEYIDSGKLKFVYRDFPLSFHPGAKPVAQATECAKEQGKFWEFHDKIFEEQDKQGEGTIQFTVKDIKSWASALGLNVNNFNQCLDSGKYKEEVEKDIADGSLAGVTGTPGFFIGRSSPDGVIEGTVIKGAQPFSVFKSIIDQELEK